MPEKTKRENDADEKPFLKERENLSDQVNDSGDGDDWSDDQKNRSYYYDDSHGYEIYNPDEDDEDSETERLNG